MRRTKARRIVPSLSFVRTLRSKEATDEPDSCAPSYRVQTVLVTQGPTLPTSAAPQVVGYLGYCGRDANVVATAAHDPLQTCARAPSCNYQRCTFSGVVAYSITSSAMARSCGGISMPSSVAVRRLMTKLNLTACWTGSSAGFAPMRMLPV